MARSDSPAWRRAFDGLEKRVAPPLTAATSSPDLQLVVQKLGEAKRAVGGPVAGVTSWGLHLVGLSSLRDVRELRRQLSEVERQLLSVRRALATESQDSQEAQ